jgi:hypothetical protein
MQRFLCYGIFLLMFSSVPSYASLTELSNSNNQIVVLDNQAGLVWVQNISMFAGGYATYQAQWSDIAQLNLTGYYGINDWRMATDPEFMNLVTKNSINDLWNAFNPMNGENYIWGRLDTEEAAFYRIIGTLSSTGANDNRAIYDIGPVPSGLGAWVVSNDINAFAPPVNTIPIPAAFTLLGSILVGILGYARIKMSS